MKINWRVRFANQNFWMTFIPAVLMLVQAVAALFGAEIDLSETGRKLLQIVDCVFVVLMALGIVNDPTTAGIGDSKQALTYEKPKE